MMLSIDSNCRTVNLLPVFMILGCAMNRTTTNRTNKISALAFVREGVLASGSSDGTVFIWALNKIVSTD